MISDVAKSKGNFTMTVGLEVLFSNVQRDVQASEDCVVCAIHWVLITNGYKCLGKGEQVIVVMRLTYCLLFFLGKLLLLW